MPRVYGVGFILEKLLAKAPAALRRWCEAHSGRVHEVARTVYPREYEVYFARLEERDAARRAVEWAVFDEMRKEDGTVEEFIERLERMCVIGPNVHGWVLAGRSLDDRPSDRILTVFRDMLQRFQRGAQVKGRSKHSRPRKGRDRRGQLDRVAKRAWRSGQTSKSSYNANVAGGKRVKTDSYWSWQRRHAAIRMVARRQF